MLVIITFADAPSVTIVYDNVTEDDPSVSLNCLAVGYPSLSTFYEWKHVWLKGNTEIRRLKGLTSETGDENHFTLPNLEDSLTYQDSGIYTCSVTNGIPDLNGTLIQTAQIALSVLCMYNAQSFNIHDVYVNV